MQFGVYLDSDILEDGTIIHSPLGVIESDSIEHLEDLLTLYNLPEFDGFELVSLEVVDDSELFVLVRIPYNQSYKYNFIELSTAKERYGGY